MTSGGSEALNQQKKARLSQGSKPVLHLSVEGRNRKNARSWVIEHKTNFRSQYYQNNKAEPFRIIDATII